MELNPESITIPLASLFEKLEAKLDRIESKLDQKADLAVVEDHGRRLAVLETKSASAAEVDAYKRWLIALAISVVLMFVAVSGLLIRLVIV